MPSRNPRRVIARWQNRESTESYVLQANGFMYKAVRATTDNVWSPPIFIGRFRGATLEFEDFIRKERSRESS